MARFRLDHDLDVAVEDGHEFQEPTQRVFGQPAMQQRRQIGPRDP